MRADPPAVGIRDRDGLITSPVRGNSFEGFMIEQIVSLETLRGPGSGYYFFRRHAGAEIDLLIDLYRSRIGFEFEAGVSATPSDWKHLQSGIAAEVIDHGILVCNGKRQFAVSEEIHGVPASAWR